MHRLLACTFVLASTVVCDAGGGQDPQAVVTPSPRHCPPATADLRSAPGDLTGRESQLTVLNGSPWKIEVEWLDHRGISHAERTLAPGQQSSHSSYMGHAYRMVRPGNPQRLVVHEQVLHRPTHTVTVSECDEDQRSDEFRSLTHDQEVPCEPSSDSSQWSCIRCLAPTQLQARTRREFGFHEGEPDSDHAVGQTNDVHKVADVPFVPALSAAGYLKMAMTPRLREALLPWYQRHKGSGLRAEPPVSGGYSNNQQVRTEMLDILDRARLGPEQDAVLKAEMQRVLQWWAARPLRHTSTYGVRVYRRGSMFINHADRADTHHASAVLQVAQTADSPGGGWPLEVIQPDGRVCEVSPCSRGCGV